MGEHELDVLIDLFDNLGLEPNKKQLHELYQIFLRDIKKETLLIDGVRIVYSKNKSKHPLFRGKPEIFAHLCTRESKIKRERIFDPERANKIHWIKKVILHKDNNRVKYFERLHSNGQNQRFLWLDSKDYVIIIREINNKLNLITAFKVDRIERNKFKKWFEEFNNKK